jgi:hypothetical protein
MYWCKQCFNKHASDRNYARTLARQLAHPRGGFLVVHLEFACTECKYVKRATDFPIVKGTPRRICIACEKSRLRALSKKLRADGKRYIQPIEKRREHMRRLDARRKAARHARAIAEGRIPGDNAWNRGLRTTVPLHDAHVRARTRFEKHQRLLREKPWNDPRLSVAEKYTTRYALDQAFRDKEKEKTRMYKFSHPQIVAGWKNHPANRRKWNQAAITADGTVTKQVVRALITQKDCAWCGCAINKDNRHIDHITPISKGGAHAENNLVAACADCNKAKASKLLFQWLPVLSEKLAGHDLMPLAVAA